ncbi:hypothetical protein Vadar_009741 [Vaccinium darrowii]|uniref:Uncharacterized protein n=1 Tax=Vaccinium darrowii TaxID=229202 RepID=A0ACB7YWD3_9ERIC|nr:hypothetical protein Vadar_009741 [Vaccinium darrowii]
MVPKSFFLLLVEEAVKKIIKWLVVSSFDLVELGFGRGFEVDLERVDQLKDRQKDSPISSSTSRVSTTLGSNSYRDSNFSLERVDLPFFGSETCEFQVGKAVGKKPKSMAESVIMDLGRLPEACCLGEASRHYLRDTEVSMKELEYAQNAVGKFGEDNRAGIEGTLHRITAIRNREDKVVCLSCRVGRAVRGPVDMVQHLLQFGESILFVGRISATDKGNSYDIYLTLATSMATRRGTTSVAAFQICLQVWMTSSLLADGLAVAAQVELLAGFVEVHASLTFGLPDVSDTYS